MSTAATELKFHLSLNVNDLEKSVAFLRLLFGVDPMKFRSDYAKFEPPHLPLVLSLEPRRSGTATAEGATSGVGSLNHLGIRMRNAAELVDVQRRLEQAGISTQREEGVECCYARQTKFWAHDPDHNLWEVYVLEEDIEHRGAGQARHDIVPQTVSVAMAGPAKWSHRMDADWPEALAAASFDEITLQGTFNSARFKDQAPFILAQSLQALRPGGRMLIHVLTSNRPLEKMPELPGPASVVSHVPTDRELLAAVETAGFTGLQLTKFGESPCFVREGAELRETKLLAWKPSEIADQPRRQLLYKGPFSQVTDELGRVFQRGQRVEVDQVTWNRLKESAGSEQFLFA